MMTKPDITELNEIMYAVSKTVTDLCMNKKKRRSNDGKKPSWKEKIDKEIEQLRGE